MFVTLDSCRYDTFESANAPNIKSIGPLHRAMAPGNFTFSSHAAMFVGFTPGVASSAEPFVNPKHTKIFKLTGAGFPGKGGEFLTLDGPNIVAALKRKGYSTYGSGAVGWFDPATETGRVLTKDFDHFYYAGDTHSLQRQLDWMAERLNIATTPVFAFLNIGETHVPYYFQGAPWPASRNPCVPFSTENDAVECRRRQKACVEYVDAQLRPLLDAFAGGTVIICADHGDCWGEDGLWEHGIHHPQVLEVPLIFRLARPEQGTR